MVSVNGDADSRTESAISDNDSSATGPPDTESDEEFFTIPERLNCVAAQNKSDVS